MTNSDAHGDDRGRIPQPADTNAVLTLPNVVTLLRFLCVPLFVWLLLAQHSYGWAFSVLVIMAGTDWVDGYVARRLKQTSALGQIMDPLADRVALLTVAVSLVIAGIAPWWLLVVLLVPDAVLTVVSLMLFRWHPNLPVSKVGKIRTAALLVGTPLLLLARVISEGSNPLWVIAWIILAIGLLGHLVAAYNYFWAILAKGREQARAKQQGQMQATPGANAPSKGGKQ